MDINLRARKSSFEETIEVIFEGKFSFGDSFELYGEYNKKGELVNCSSGCSCRNPQYYIEVSEVFKRMLEIQGDPIIKLIKEIEEIENKYDKILEDINKEINLFDTRVEINNTKKELATEESRYNRLKNPQSIENANIRIENLSNKLTKLNHEYAIMEQKFSDVYYLKQKEISNLPIG